MRAQHPQEILDTALDALSSGDGWQAALDGLTVPIYTTDADGAVNYWNRSCADLAGREPKLGEDRWCVTWHLYTTCGDPLPHSECPMARAIQEQREIRDEIIIAERPDGRRIACRPYPTPVWNDDGSLRGAVNLLVDVTSEQAIALADQSARCRRLAEATHDTRASDILRTMAGQYERTAADLRSG